MKILRIFLICLLEIVKIGRKVMRFWKLGMMNGLCLDGGIMSCRVGIWSGVWVD